MVRNYIKKNLRVNYSLDDLKKAVDAVQCQGVTLKYASETYGVPLSTLAKKYKKSHDNVTVGGGRKKELTDEEEQTLMVYLKTCSASGDDSSLFEEDNNIPAKKIKFKNGDYISSSGSELEIESDDQSIDEKKLKIDIKLESYYAIYYEDTWYLGRVIDFWDENKTKIKFMKKDLDNYIWPRKEDIHTVENRFIFYGPIDLVGNYPFKVKRSDGLRIIKEYKNLKKKT